MKRAKPDAESDDFGALCMHVRMLFRFLEGMNGGPEMCGRGVFDVSI